MKSNPAVEVVLHIPTILGEGPLWSQQEQVLYWLDILKPTINRFDPSLGSNEVIQIAEPIYALGLSENGFIAALESGFALLSKHGTVKTCLSNPIAGEVNFNDGKVDGRGRFWSGTMARDWKSPIGALYKVENDGHSHEMDRSTDFGRRCIYAYDFDLEFGHITAQRLLIELQESEGSPDGITVDAEGGIWVAHWDGWCITRHRPDGRPISRIHMPVPRPTSVMFGGKDLNTLYITSATMHLSDSQLSAAPLSGALFAVTPGMKGLPEPQFRYQPN